MRRRLGGWALVLFMAALGGCGSMGPLYFPDDPHPPVYVPPAKSPASATSAPPATHASEPAAAASASD